MLFQIFVFIGDACQFIQKNNSDEQYNFYLQTFTVMVLVF